MRIVSWRALSRFEPVGQTHGRIGELARGVARGDHRELTPDLDRDFLRGGHAEPEAEVVTGLVDLVTRSRELGLADSEIREEVESAPVRVSQDRVQPVGLSIEAIARVRDSTDRLVAVLVLGLRV